MPEGVDAECGGDQEAEQEAADVGGYWRGGPVAYQALHDEDPSDGAGDDGSVASAEVRSAEEGGGEGGQRVAGGGVPSVRGWGIQ
jgi:hypothetical protein